MDGTVRVLDLAANEKMSGLDAPIDAPDPKGSRPCYLRLIVSQDAQGRITIVGGSIFGEGNVLDVPHA